MNAEGEPIPVRPINEDWLGHKGMADAALYIYKKLKEDHLLTKAFNWDPERHTQDFEIVCVGHSLGAGTATILAIMLKQEFPNTKCYAFSPPGGLIRYYCDTHCLKITQNVAFEFLAFWHFRPIFV